jgi:hypothetical protein
MGVRIRNMIYLAWGLSKAKLYSKKISGLITRLKRNDILDPEQESEKN